MRLEYTLGAALLAALAGSAAAEELDRGARGLVWGGHYQYLVSGGGRPDAGLGAREPNLPLDVAMGWHTRGRLEATLGRGGGLALHAAGEYEKGFDNLDRELLTRTPGLRSRVDDRARVPLDWRLHARGFEGRLRVDRLELEGRLGPVGLRVGRQPVALGRGEVLRALDVVAPLRPFEIDRLRRRGVDAARLSLEQALWSLEALYVPRYDGWEEASALGRAEAALGPASLELLGGRHRGAWLAGGALTLTAGPVTLHGEGALRERRGGEQEPAASAAAELALPAARVELSAEYRYDGAGAATPAGYTELAASEAYARGEVPLLGRQHAAMVASWRPARHWRLTGRAVMNLRDPSALAGPSLTWEAAPGTELGAGLLLSAGRRPRGEVLFSEHGIADPMAWGLARMYF